MIQGATKKLVDGVSLTRDEARAVMESIMMGEATPAQIGGFLVALRMKGETVDEIAGCASVMRGHCHAIPIDPDGLVDTCGTGGDGAATINVSTAAAFVAAGAGARIAKHGNRAVSSRCGSADVLEALGVALDLTPEAVARAIAEIGVGFMFAPSHHPAMRHAAVPRRELGLRTVFNLLGPLTNPAGARRQLVGVFAPGLTVTLARVLAALGAERALVVHGEDGLDEITVTGRTRAAFLDDGEVREMEIDPGALGLGTWPPESLRGGTSGENAAHLRGVLEGRAGAMRDIVLANAGAALWIAGRAGDLREGVAMARRAIDSGAASAKLEALAGFTRREAA